MTPQETQFVKVLVESGLISFKEAGHLEHTQEQVKEETGEHKPVWDIAVEEGIVTQAQASRFIDKLDRVVEAVTQAAEGEATSTQEVNTQNLAPVKELDTRNLAPIAGQVAQASRKGGRRLGNYMLESKLGQGGMGAVYKAHQESMDRTVAIKVLPRNLAQNQDFIGRFLREAKAAGKLSHPNIVAGIDTGFAEGYYYFAMEYVEGRALDKCLQEGPLDEPEVVRIGLQMTDALDHAHELGIVHRDVKPENILLTLGGQAKLCDLGLARSTGDDMRITQAGLAVGTPYYISPEQARGEDPGPHADIYSLGATLYHLVTGQVPFDGDNPMAVMQKHLNEIPRRPTDVRPTGVSNAFEAVIMKMMARNLQNRYETMADVEADLEKVASGEVPAALRGAMAQRRAGGRRGTRGTRSTSSRRPVGGRRTTDATQPVEAAGRFPTKLVATGVACVVLVVALVAFFVLRKDDDPQDTDVTQVDPEADRLKRLEEDFGAIQAFEKKSPDDYAAIVKRYTDFLPVATGTKFEERARAALADVRKRQESDKSEERLAKLKIDLEVIASFEKANPEKYSELIAKYTSFMGGAAGTDFEARAKSAIEAVTGRRKTKAGELLAATRTAVKTEQDGGRFGAALARVNAFPKVYASVVAKELQDLRRSVQDSGKAKWNGILAEARKLVAGRKFAAAKSKAEEGKALGLGESQAWVSQALVEIEKARLTHEEKIAAEYRARYKSFTAEYARLVKAGKFEDALKRGEPLKGKLGADLDKQLAADLGMARDARDFMKGLRARLKKAARGSFVAVLPMGSARFVGYDADKDRISFKFGMGSTSMKTTDFRGEKLVDLARRSAGGKLAPAEARRAACYLLAVGQTKGVAALLAKAKEGGLDVKVLEEQLAVLGKGAREVEAERLLARFDKQFKAKSWLAAVMAGKRLLKEYSDTGIVKDRKDLAALIEKAEAQGSPIAERTLTLQDGLNVEGKAYSGTRDTFISGTDREKDMDKGDADVLYSMGTKYRMLVRFALFRSGGGPIPDGAHIVSAKLCMFKLKAYPSTIATHEVLKDWDESAARHATSGKGGAWAEAGCEGADKDRSAAAVGTCEVSYAQEQWAEVDVTESLRAWSARKRSNYGWVLIDDHEKDKTNYRRYCSREYKDDATRRPKLIVRVRSRALKSVGPTPVTPAGPSSFAAAWQKLNLRGDGPGKRCNTTTAMTYDSKRKRCVFYGGHLAQEDHNDLWTLDLTAGSWTCLQKHEQGAAGRPPGAREHHFKYDAQSDLYRLNLGWAYDPNTNAWKQPDDWTVKARTSAYVGIRRGMAYCPESGYFLTCTWQAGRDPLRFALTNFRTRRSERGSADVPIRSFCDGGLVYDSRARVFVMFSGTGSTGDHRDTWIFNPRNKKWQEMKPAVSPPPRGRHNLIWHDRLGAIVMSGGAVNGKSGAAGVEDLWVYETARNLWTEIKIAKSPPRTGSGANATTYDAAHKVVVLVNGPGEVWALRIQRATR